MVGKLWCGACIWDYGAKEVLKSYKFREENISIIYLLEKHDKILISTVFLIVTMQKQVLTNFSGHGKSNNLTMPKSSPVTRLIPEWETQAQFTSAFSACLDQIPMTSSPRTLKQKTKKFFWKPLQRQESGNRKQISYSYWFYKNTMFTFYFHTCTPYKVLIL